MPPHPAPSVFFFFNSSIGVPMLSLMVGCKHQHLYCQALSEHLSRHLYQSPVSKHFLASMGREAFGFVKAPYPSVGECQGGEAGVGVCGSTCTEAQGGRMGWGLPEGKTRKGDYMKYK